MRNLLSPSALALALGTPAYGMPAVGGIAPSALTPHAPMRVVPAAPPSASAPPGRPTPAVPPRAVSDSGRPTVGRDDARAAATADTLAVPDSTVAPSDTARVALPAVSRVVPAARILGRPAANRPGRVRVEVSLAARTLVVLQGGDTLLVAPAGVGSNDTLRFGAQRWRFATPPGRRVVQAKEAAPVWVPPEWHYAEFAARRGYTLRHLRVGAAESLGGGRRLVVRGGRVGVLDRGGAFAALPADEEIVFGHTLYVPPFGTANRQVPGQLGAYRLALGDGFLIHGTPDTASVGLASSHGCLRLSDDALAWVYRHVPVGAAVVIR